MARQADVFATGVSSIDQDSARTLVAGTFSDAYQVKGETVDQEPIPFRIEVSLVKVDGEWLVDDFTPGDRAPPSERTVTPELVRRPRRRARRLGRADARRLEGRASPTSTRPTPLPPPSTGRRGAPRPGRRAAYDASLARLRRPRDRRARRPAPRPTPARATSTSDRARTRCGGRPTGAAAQGRTVPGWLLAALAVVIVALLAAARGACAGAVRRRRSRRRPGPPRPRPSAPSCPSCPTAPPPRRGPGARPGLPHVGLPQGLRQALRGDRRQRPGDPDVGRGRGRGLGRSCAPARTGWRCWSSSTGPPPTSSSPSRRSTGTRSP